MHIARNPLDLVSHAFYQLPWFVTDKNPRPFYTFVDIFLKQHMLCKQFFECVKIIHISPCHIQDFFGLFTVCPGSSDPT